MISLYSPYSENPAFQYTVNYVFSQIWGLPYELLFHGKPFLQVSHKNKTCQFPLKDWNNLSLPKDQEIYSELLLFDGASGTEDYDFLYYIFLIISRYEEFISDKVDTHGRFPLSESFISGDSVNRPIVDEYVDFLKDEIRKRLNLSILLFREHHFKFNLSFDVDTPRNPYYINYLTFVKGLIKRDGRLNFNLIGDSIEFLKDDYFNYPEVFKLIDVNKHNPYLFFISGHSHSLDGNYKLTDHAIQWLLLKAKEMKITIGVHGSYNSSTNSAILISEKQALEKASGTIVSEIRQHFLKFSLKHTYQEHEKAGLRKDWSLGYAEKIGFRAGTCRPFRPYCHQSKKTLNLIEEPLMIMDATLVQSKYMNLKTSSEMICESRLVFQACKKHDGHFNILFHNTHLRNPEVFKFYEEVLKW